MIYSSINIRLTWFFSKANLVIYKLCCIHSMAVRHEIHEKYWGQVFRRIWEIGIFLMNCVWCLIHRAWALWGICLTCNASQFSHGLQYYWNDPELYASHWSLVNISTDSFLLLTGHLNIALFPKTKVFSHEISNSFSLWDCPISNNKPSNWNICYQFPFPPHIIL